MTQLRFLALSFTAIGALAITGCVDDSKLRVQNDSDFAIVEIRVAERVDRWSENVLSGDILQPGESLTIRLDCGTYDAQLIDETNTTCEIHDIDLCFSRADWIIRNNTCSFRAARAAQEAERAGDLPTSAQPSTAVQPR